MFICKWFKKIIAKIKLWKQNRYEEKYDEDEDTIDPDSDYDFS